ncbi:MAG: FeoB-associated Cys-rich membrane protein [Parasporobacterium sp.]|nr:FeoB-associated Cys-rich membrane protein [Parasporobacterium sp.]
MNAIDIIILILILAAVSGAVLILIHRKKNGTGCCGTGCPGNCSRCSRHHIDHNNSCRRR